MLGKDGIVDNLFRHVRKKREFSCVKVSELKSHPWPSFLLLINLQLSLGIPYLTCFTSFFGVLSTPEKAKWCRCVTSSLLELKCSQGSSVLCCGCSPWHRAVLYCVVAAALVWIDRPLPRADSFPITAHVGFTSIHWLITLDVNRKKCATHQFQPRKSFAKTCHCMFCFQLALKHMHFSMFVYLCAYKCIRVYIYTHVFKIRIFPCHFEPVQ